MLIAAAPSKDDERASRAFSGANGEWLRYALKLLGLTNDVYMTHVVQCRSISKAFDSEGQPRFNERGKQLERDAPPTPAQAAACTARLLEEIYLVDPLIIVLLGSVPVKTLVGSAEIGALCTVEVPGGTYYPHITSKKKQWARKQGGEIQLPVRPSTVKYPAIACPSVEDARAREKDRRADGTYMRTVNILKKVRDVYSRYRVEVLGEAPVEREAYDDAAMF
jgi:uracil-DNA glycosylase